MNLGGRNKKSWNVSSDETFVPNLNDILFIHICATRLMRVDWISNSFSHLRFSRRLDSQLVTVYATMWQ